VIDPPLHFAERDLAFEIEKGRLRSLSRRWRRNPQQYRGGREEEGSSIVAAAKRKSVVRVIDFIVCLAGTWTGA